jgi:hypothetical protein
LLNPPTRTRKLDLKNQEQQEPGEQWVDYLLAVALD